MYVFAGLFQNKNLEGTNLSASNVNLACSQILGHDFFSISECMHAFLCKEGSEIIWESKALEKRSDYRALHASSKLDVC